MLKSLRVRNFALIDDIELEFAEGLNVLTGETGAGKSLIVDCLSLIAGCRADAINVKRGTEAAAIEAAFDITGNEVVKAALSALDLEPDPDGLLLLYREVMKSGKSRARIDGRLVSAGELSEIADCLIDIFGQHEGLRIMRPAAQLEAIDSYIHQEDLELPGLSRNSFAEWRAANAALAALMEKANDRQSRLDFLQYQIKELEDAAVRPGEEATLLEEAKVLANSEKLFEALSSAYTAIYDTGSDDRSAIDLAKGAMSNLVSASRLGLDMKLVEDQLTIGIEALLASAEASRRIRDSLDMDPARSTEVEGRLAEIGRIKRKFHLDADELESFEAQCKTEARELKELEIRTDSARQDLQNKQDQMLGLMMKLSEARRIAAESLSKIVQIQLTELMMPKARFRASLNRRGAAGGFDIGGGEYVSATGLEEAEFLFCANVGEELKPLSKIASGGELSRFMLAFKVAGIQIAKGGPVMVFDEVDQGVGGAAANHVAAKLREVSRKGQALAVTHLAQIAAASDRQVLISKKDDGERSFIEAKPVAGDDKCIEIARMLSGTASPEAIEHARIMIEKWQYSGKTNTSGSQAVTKDGSETFSLFERVD